MYSRIFNINFWVGQYDISRSKFCSETSRKQSIRLVKVPLIPSCQYARKDPTLKDFVRGLEYPLFLLFLVPRLGRSTGYFDIDER